MTAPLPRLLFITDGGKGDRLLFPGGKSSLSPFPVGIQLRNPGASDETFLRLAQELKALCDAAGLPLFVNGRVEVALQLGAHLHLPSRGMRPAEARARMGADRWISVAVHDETEARRAQGADLALVSPVFGAGSKPHDVRPLLGVAGLERIAAALPCPAYALGGIAVDTVERLRGSRAAGIAVISAIRDAADPQAAAAALLSAFDGDPTV